MLAWLRSRARIARDRDDARASVEALRVDLSAAEADAAFLGADKIRLQAEVDRLTATVRDMKEVVDLCRKDRDAAVKALADRVAKDSGSDFARFGEYY